MVLNPIVLEGKHSGHAPKNPAILGVRHFGRCPECAIVCGVVNPASTYGSLPTVLLNPAGMWGGSSWPCVFWWSFEGILGLLVVWGLVVVFCGLVVSLAGVLVVSGWSPVVSAVSCWSPGFRGRPDRSSS